MGASRKASSIAKVKAREKSYPHYWCDSLGVLNIAIRHLILQYVPNHVKWREPLKRGEENTD
jgi:hypothetical protein